jgi:hypothetical protein
MALPAMITGFGEQSANYGAAVGQSLAQLGQQVGQQLAMREYQRQASAALPAMQQAYKSAFDKMGQGQYADGYMELLNTNLQYGATTNPFIAQFAEQANQTAKQMESAMWRQAQYGERGGPTTPITIPGMRVPTAQELADPNYTPDTTITDVTFDGDMDARFVGDDMTQGSPAQREAQRAADREYRTYEDADRAAAAGLPAMEQQEGFSFGAGVLSQYRPEKQTIESTSEEIASFKGLSREKQDAYKDQVIETDTEYRPPQGRVAEPFQGMIGFEDAQYIEGPAKGGFRVASIQEDYDSKGQKITRKLEPASSDDVNTFNGFVANMDKTNRFVTRNPKLRKMLEAAGGNPNRIDISEEEADVVGEVAYRATIDGQDYGILSTAPDFNERLAIEFLQDAPAVIRRNGWRVIKGEASAAAPAPAAGGSVAERVRAQYGKKEGATQPATPSAAAAAATATEAVEFSEDNPYAKGLPAMSQAAPRPPTSAGRGTGTRERQVAERKLKEVNEQIKNLDSYRKVGRRPSTKEERAIRWEELNEEKKRLERLLSSR